MTGSLKILTWHLARLIMDAEAKRRFTVIGKAIDALKLYGHYWYLYVLAGAGGLGTDVRGCSGNKNNFHDLVRKLLALLNHVLDAVQNMHPMEC